MLFPRVEGYFELFSPERRQVGGRNNLARARSRQLTLWLLPQSGCETSGGASNGLLTCDCVTQGRAGPFERAECYTEDSRCPSLSFLVLRYLRVESDAGISSGTASDTDNPYPCSPTNLRGLFVSNRIVFMPRSVRIWAPIP